MQWRHQLDIFSNALQTGQLDVRAFGLEFLVCLLASFSNHSTDFALSNKAYYFAHLHALNAIPVTLNDWQAGSDAVTRCLTL